MPMKQLLKSQLILKLIIPIILLLGCKQPETVIVTDEPSSPSPTSQTQNTVGQTASFMQLNIGETDRISSLDPLFAENVSTMRTQQLIYEGLVRYDENTRLVPAVAKEWKVSPDSLTYRFTLHSNIYYHDSNAFNTGVGRRLTARDIKFVFERMAWLTVPDRAAKLFMTVEGFEPFYQEQHNVLNPADRQLSGVKGINIPNDSTVVFNLIKRDPNFLAKLASPLAVVYPREAVSHHNPSAFEPVGTGPFTFSQKKGSRFIFSSFDNYHRQGEPILNRVDVIEIADTPNLVQHLNQRNLHLIPQPGPQLLNAILDSQGQLIKSLTGSFTFNLTPAQTYHLLNYNPKSTLDPAQAKFIAQRAGLSLLPPTQQNLVKVRRFTDQDSQNTTSISDTVKVTYTSNPYMRYFLRQLSDTLMQNDVALQMLNIRTPVQSTGLFTNAYVPLYSVNNWASTENALLGFSVRQSILSLDNIKQLNFNRYPWWINLRTTTMAETENTGL